MKRIIRRPSPAMIVAIAALVAALGGTAVAGPQAIISALNKKEKKQTRNIANSEIDKRAPGLSVANAQNATNASAVGGMKVAKIFEKLPANSPTTQIYNANGLVISAGCTGGNPVLTALGPTTGEMQAQGNGAGTPYFLEQNGFSTPRDLTNAHPLGAVTLSYANTSGAVVTMDLGYDNNPNFGGTNSGCAITGTAIASG